MDQPDIADIVTGLEIKLRHTDQAKLDALTRKLDIEFREYVAFQEVKALAHADGRLSYENALYIYDQLGSGPEDFNSRPVAVKVILTQVFAQLLQPGAV
jgi:hypothetical protein